MNETRAADEMKAIGSLRYPEACIRFGARRLLC